MPKAYVRFWTCGGSPLLAQLRLLPRVHKSLRFTYASDREQTATAELATARALSISRSDNLHSAYLAGHSRRCVLTAYPPPIPTRSLHIPFREADPGSRVSLNNAAEMSR